MLKVKINENIHVLKQNGLNPFESERYRDYREKWKEYPLTRKVDRFPIHLDIEVTSNCNLKCQVCITTHADFDNGFMKFDLFRKIVDEGIDKGLCSIKLNLRGEPLLHPNLPDMISYAKQKGIIDVFFNTNAVLLTNDKAKSIIEAGIDRLIISFDGYEKGFYESHRVGAVYEETLENVRNLMVTRDKMNRSFPWVRVQTILVDGMENNINQYLQLWENIVDEVAYIDYRPEIDRVKVGKNDWVCPQIWQRMSITWDGSILPCVNDPFGKMCMGKVSEVSIEEVWVANERLNNMRKMHDAGNAHEIDGCVDCPLRSTQILRNV